MAVFLALTSLKGRQQEDSLLFIISAALRVKANPRAKDSHGFTQRSADWAHFIQM